MFYHLLIIHHSYKLKKRIGFHVSSHKPIVKKDIEYVIEKMKKEYRGLKATVHKLKTNSPAIDSIFEKDSYYNGIVFYEDSDRFFSVLSEAKEDVLEPLDVVKTIVKRYPKTPLEIQKFMYLLYAELLQSDIKLFKEPIIAYKDGPVIKSVFQFYKGSSDIIETKLDSFTEAKISNYAHYVDLIKAIESIQGKTQHLSANKRVDITHVNGGPWHSVCKRQSNSENRIDDTLIRAKHFKVADALERLQLN